jgi:HPt (histidine-containing phosphotransfer) domain-containing protein
MLELRLQQLTAQFAADAPEQIAALQALVAQLGRASSGARRQLLTDIELRAHQLSGRAAIFECQALSAHAALLEQTAAACLGGATIELRALQHSCRAMSAALAG